MEGRFSGSGDTAITAELSGKLNVKDAFSAHRVDCSYLLKACITAMMWIFICRNGIAEYLTPHASCTILAKNT